MTARSMSSAIWRRPRCCRSASHDGPPPGNGLWPPVDHSMVPIRKDHHRLETSPCRGPRSRPHRAGRPRVCRSGKRNLPCFLSRIRPGERMSQCQSRPSHRNSDPANREHMPLVRHDAGEPEAPPARGLEGGATIGTRTPSSTFPDPMAPESPAGIGIEPPSLHRKYRPTADSKSPGLADAALPAPTSSPRQRGGTTTPWLSNFTPPSDTAAASAARRGK